MTEDTVTKLKAQIKVVVDARQVAVSLKVLRDNLLAEWNKEHQELLDSLTQAGADVAVSESTLRELTLRAYAETGSKAPVEGVGIREMTVLSYDSRVAFDWAKAHKIALKLDTNAFEKIAKADPPDFVKITTEPQATIATKLEKALGELG